MGSNESVPQEGMEDLNFMGQTEVSPVEAAGADNNAAEVAEALAKAQESYGWDTPDQHRAGFN